MSTKAAPAAGKEPATMPNPFRLSPSFALFPAVKQASCQLILRLSLGLALAAFGTNAAAYNIPPPNPQSTNNPDFEILQKMSRGVAQIAKQANQAIVFVSVYKNIESMPPGMVDPFEFFFGPRGGQGGQGPGGPGQGGPGGQGMPGGQQPGGRGQRGAPHGQQHQEKREEGLGSGFFVDVQKGYIITNNHVVQGADEIQLKLANGETYVGKVVGRDPNTDVAVVQVKKDDFNRTGLAALPLGDSATLQVGDFVVALGAPFGLEASLSFGVVSAMGRGSLGIAQIGNFIQTDAAINPGNSGGPLIDMHGQVIGMNTAIYSRSGGYNGIGFAVPASLVRTVAEQLINTGRVRRGYLGVQLQQLDEEMISSLNLPEGVHGGGLVTRVLPNGPAARGGVEAGDIIAEVNAGTMRDPHDITTSIGLMKPGMTADLTVYRDGKKQHLKVTVAQHPDDLAEGQEGPNAEAAPAGKELQFGMAMTNWNKNLQARYATESRYGVFVTTVEPDSAADRAGLRPGDLVLKVDNMKVQNLDDWRKAVKGKSKILARIERGGEYYFVTLKE